MPVYETPESYLREAIESILGQTFSDFEFLILDDGSKATYIKDVVDSFHDQRIIYSKSDENKGIIFQLNRGFSLAKGEYIARMDSDDISLPTRFEKQVAYLDTHPETVVLGTGAEFFPATQIWLPLSRFTYYDLIRWKPFIIHPTVMFRASTIKKYDLQFREEFKLAEDYDLWRRLIHFGHLDNLQEVLLRYRQDGKNVSLQNREAQRKVRDRIRWEMTSFLMHDRRLQLQLLDFLCGVTFQ